MLFGVIIVAVAICDFLLGLFIKNYLPAYMDEKGKNLATKEDIQEITRLTEEVQQDFRKDLEQFGSDLHFKYDFYYKQYVDLYSYLYAIIIQSEYVRKYIRDIRKQDIKYEDAPFITITPINRKTQKLEFKQGERAKISESTEQIETPISKFNFDSLVEYIISHSALADQNLMKYAVSYRFAHSVVNGKEQDIEAENEDSRLQDAIIKSIVRTYNQLRKYLKMDYVQYELETGELQFLES